MSKLKELKTPVFAAEGIQYLNPTDYRLKVTGLVDNPRTLSLSELQTQFPNTTSNSRLTSVSGWSVRANWNGISWDAFVQLIKPKETARYVVFTSSGDYTTAVWLTDLAGMGAMIVWGVEGEPLEEEYGGPLRIIIPHLWGYKSCKWLSKMDFVAKYITGYWELRGYSHRAQIEPGETFDVNTQKYRPIGGGEVTEF